MAIDSFPGIDTPEQALSRPGPGGKQDFYGKDGFGFFDFLDIINPLQHIPILSGLYRKITGDEISMGARLIGGSLFGGPIGFAAAMANVVVEGSSGKDIGGHLFAMVDGDGDGPEVIPANVASAAPLGGGATPFTGGAASGADASPMVGLPGPAIGAAAGRGVPAVPLFGAGAGRGGPFAFSLDLPAAARNDHARRSEPETSDDDRVDRVSAYRGGRVQDLSAAQLVQILTQFQRATGASPGRAPFSVEPGPPPWSGILPLDPAFE